MDEKGLLNLTDMHKAIGGRAAQRPVIWLANDFTEEFILAIAKGTKGRKSDLLVVRPGRLGGTFAHWQIALAYAKYLSPELHMEVNKTYMRYKAADPNLALEVIDKQKDVALRQRVQPDIG